MQRGHKLGSMNLWKEDGQCDFYTCSTGNNVFHTPPVVQKFALNYICIIVVSLAYLEKLIQLNSDIVS